MFKEPGKKIKILSYVLVVAATIVGIFLGWEVKLADSYVIGCICVTAAFFFGSWLTGLFLSAFGELVEDVSTIKQNILESKEKSNKE